MGQAITDYVKFLADARDAVYRLNCDQNTAGQLADEEEMKERELETARKAVSDSVNLFGGNIIALLHQGR